MSLPPTGSLQRNSRSTRLPPTFVKWSKNIDTLSEPGATKTSVRGTPEDVAGKHHAPLPRKLYLIVRRLDTEANHKDPHRNGADASADSRRREPPPRPSPSSSRVTRENSRWWPPRADVRAPNRPRCIIGQRPTCPFPPLSTRTPRSVAID